MDQQRWKAHFSENIDEWKGKILLGDDDDSTSPNVENEPRSNVETVSISYEFLSELELY